jgi:hypothetical protein
MKCRQQSQGAIRVCQRMTSPDSMPEVVFEGTCDRVVGQVAMSKNLDHGGFVLVIEHWPSSGTAVIGGDGRRAA